MGGYGSGGHNKSHGQVEKYKRLDSFSLRRFIADYEALRGRRSILWGGGSVLYDPVEDAADIRMGEHFRPLKLAYVEGIDGELSRLYFHCPLCRRRVRYLYNYRNFHVCRHCLKVNYRSQQTRPEDLEIIRRKMRKLIQDDLGYWDWRRDYPNAGISDLRHIPRAPYMRRERYARLIEQYRELQDDHTRVFLRAAGGFLPPEVFAELSACM